MKSSNGKTELLAVASICVLLSFAEARFGALSAVAGFLSTALPSGHNYAIAIGGALWIGMGVYSLRRRHELSLKIKAYQKLQSEFETSVITDKMTGLPNRHGLEIYLNATAAELAADRDLILVAIHFLNWPMIANVQGFAIADAISTAVTERLVANVRVPDLVAGANCERYYLLLQGEHRALAARANELAVALIETLRSVVIPNGSKLPLSLHVGMAALSHCPRRPTSTVAAEMMRRCDLAVHEATQRGAGAIVVFDEMMEKSIDRRGVIEVSLDAAIRDGHIVPHFQPLIELATGAVAGFEVLARWKHPTLGPVPPSVFIPIATETGRLEELTLAILDRSCRAARQWPGMFRIAINVSPKSLNNERFLDDFVAVVKGAGFRADRVEIEITEDAFVHDAFALAGPIGKLKSEGMSLAIDDFGTGYSSLRHLQLLPFDKIKIDQSFVLGMINEPESRKIVEAIIGLGRSMGLTTVAEGIEREDQLAALRTLGCKIGQGYIFSAALPAEQAAGFLQGRNAVAEPIRNERKLAIAS